MEAKELIVLLIQQDLKHNQLTEGLRQIGLDDNGKYCLDIQPMVASLMGIEKGYVSDRWAEIYGSFMDNAHETKVSGRGVELIPVAEKCYEMLVACVEIEHRTKS